MKRLAFIILLTLAACALVWAYADNPPNRRTGAPGENLCSGCHNTYAENSGSGILSISGLPASYDPLAVYPVTVTISQTGLSSWGFEAAVKDSNNLQAGTLTITDATNTISGVSSGITYIKQTSAGTYAGTANGPVSWSFNWTAPAAGTHTVFFYVSGIAANDNGSSSGDYGYHISQQVQEKTSDVNDNNSQGSQKPGRFDLQQNYPNPFNPSTRIQFRVGSLKLADPDHTTLKIYNILGQMVRTLLDEEMIPGDHQVTWDGKDDKGEKVSSGIYFYRLEAGGYSETRTMVLIR